MRKYAIVCFVLLCTTAIKLEAARVLPMNLPQLVEDAGMIFLGKCVEVKSGKDPETGLVVTWFTFEVSQGIKGDVGETETIKQLGGTHKGLTVTSFTPGYPIGEEILLFVYPTSSVGLTSAVGLHQGKFNIRVDRKTGKRKVSNGMPESILFAPEPVKASKKRGYRIKGENDPLIAKAKTMELKPFIESIREMVKETRQAEER